MEGIKGCVPRFYTLLRVDPKSIVDCTGHQEKDTRSKSSIKCEDQRTNLS